MQDTPIKVAQCNRCEQYVFSCRSNGLSTVADPAPLGDVTAYVAALAAGRRVFDLQERAGRPHSLQTRSRASKAPAWPPSGTQRPILAEHACATDASVVEVPDAGPHQAPATPGAASAGLRRPHALAGAQPASQRLTASSQTNRPNPAAPANPRPSDPGGSPRCDSCGEWIGDLPFIGVHYREWQWAQHSERCPNVAQKEG